MKIKKLWTIGGAALLMLLAGCAAATGGDGAAAPNTDPYYGAGASAATASAARATSAYFGQQITATAEARQATAAQRDWLDAQRQTGVAQTATREVWLATATAASIQSTSTAEATGTMAARTQQALNVLQTATVAAVFAGSTQQAIVAESNRLALEREATMNQVRAAAPWVGMGLLFALLMWLAVVLGWAQAKRAQVIKRDERGDAPILVSGDNIYDPDRNPGPVLISRRVPEIPQLTAEGMQAEVTRRDQAIDLVHRGLVGQAAGRAKLGRWQAEIAPDGGAATAVAGLPAAAEWQRMMRWPGGPLVLGVGEQGPVLVDPESHPHLLFAGTSGSGKSRGGLRPLVAEALADGWQVVILDRSGLDFQPFAQHSNVRLVTLGKRPEEAIGYLRSVYSEVVRRFGLLREAGASTWGRWVGRNGARVLVVVDEFSDLADSLAAGEREELWRQARLVAAEGRKSGVHLAIALQDPTYKSLDLRIRRNMTPVCFRVLDDAASRVVLGAGGADRLKPGQFLTAAVGQLAAGVAFNPDDGEIATFLERRAVARLGAPEWLQLEEPKASVSSGCNGEDDLAERVKELARQGLSLNEIQRRVFGYTGGAAFAMVRGVLGGTTVGGGGSTGEEMG